MGILKEGAMRKTLHAGKSSYAGVLSAYLARAVLLVRQRYWKEKKAFAGLWSQSRIWKN